MYNTALSAAPSENARSQVLCAMASVAFSARPNEGGAEAAKTLLFQGSQVRRDENVFV